MICSYACDGHVLCPQTTSVYSVSKEMVLVRGLFWALI